MKTVIKIGRGLWKSVPGAGVSAFGEGMLAGTLCNRREFEMMKLFYFVAKTFRSASVDFKLSIIKILSGRCEMKKVLASLVIGVALCVGGVNDTFAVTPTGGTITTIAPYSDNFDRANATTIGGNWVENTNDWEILSNHLHEKALSGGSNSIEICSNTTALGGANYDVSVDVTHAGTSGDWLGPIGRYNGISTFYVALLSGSGNLMLFEVVNGTFTQIGSTYASGNGNGTVKLSMDGTTIKAYLNGTERVSGTGSAITATGVAGVAGDGDNTSTGDYFDNFSVGGFPIYTVHTFTSGGTFTAYNAGNIAVLVVGGGGGASSWNYGGGGGGGYQYSASFAVTPQTYTITVGNGGAGGQNSGQDSVFSTITAMGGGGGGGSIDGGKNGGSGGGGGWGVAGYGTGSQGSNGGAGATNAGGGGGGASAVGTNASMNRGGNGGNGTSNSITGSAVYYAGGGGGGYYYLGAGPAGTGGAGGGGNGSADNAAGTAGTANTGGGGGAGGPGQAGGSGIVIIRYLTSDFPANIPPSAFSLLTPPDQNSTNDNTPAFNWGTSTDPESQPISYTLKLSTTAGFTEPVYRTVSSLPTTAYTAVTEIADGSYYWKVIASDGVLQTESTQTWQLTVDTQRPVAPVLTGIVSDPQTGKIIEIRGTGENGTTLTFYDKNNNTISGTPVWAGDTFTFTPTTPLDPGSPVYVRSQDVATNSSQSRTHMVMFEDYMDIFKADDVYHGSVPGNSIRMEKDTSCAFDIAVNAGSPVTVRAWLMYNSYYDGSGADAPTITLSGPGITTGNTAAMTSPASYTPDTWEQLTVSGTPNEKGVVTLTVETSSTADSAKTWVDDITVEQ